jgi:hypothetical protein
VTNNFDMAAVLVHMADGATLHELEAVERSPFLVWPDGRTRSVDVYVRNALDDCDFMTVLRSNNQGNEFGISADGRRWFAEWQDIILRAEDVLWELYPALCRQVLRATEQPPHGWLTQEVYNALVAGGMDPNRLAERVNPRGK